MDGGVGAGVDRAIVLRTQVKADLFSCAEFFGRLLGGGKGYFRRLGPIIFRARAIPGTSLAASLAAATVARVALVRTRSVESKRERTWV